MTIKISSKVLALVLSCMGVISAEAMHHGNDIMGFNDSGHYTYVSTGDFALLASEAEKDKAEPEACSKAVEHGDRNTQFNLNIGMAYRRGDGTIGVSDGDCVCVSVSGFVHLASEIERDKAEFEECSKAAERGDPNAQFNMGMVYQCGLIVPQDYEKAESLYLKTVEQNYAPAQCELGRMYLHVQKDFKKAFGLFLMAAKQGDTTALYMLGIMFANGLYVKQNQEVARKLYEASGYLPRLKKSSKD